MAPPRATLRMALIGLWLPAIGMAQAVLGTDHGGPELAVRGRVEAPIRHQAHFRGERELFGYRPRFTPNTVTFDARNRPYMRTGQLVQTLDDTGRWVGLNFGDSIRREYPTWDGVLREGTSFDQRVVFDSQGSAYTLICATTSNLKGWLLLHSRDGCRTWDVHPVALRRAVLEHQDGHNRIDGPPVIAMANGESFTVIAPRTSPDGSLTVPKPVIVADGECWTTPYHSGGSNVTVTRGGRTHIVWLDSSAPSGHDTLGDIYVAAYDRATGSVSDRVLLGHTQRDNHNGPVITLDSRGYLHVLIGGHHFPFRYTRSLKPNDATAGWTEPKPIGWPKRRIGEGSYTYTALVCGPDDTLHLASRWAGHGYAFHLVTMRKRPGGEWEMNRDLVIPFKNLYSVWYHKVTLDRQGRLFLNYCYYGSELKEDQALAYRAKWPGEELFDIPPEIEDRPNGMQLRVTWHDPAMLMSDDTGDTWRLAVTADFADAVTGPLHADDSLPLTRTNNAGMALRLIQPGDFAMGDSDGDLDERPGHPVRIRRPFYLGQYEVTLGQFKHFVRATGYRTELERTDPESWYAWLGKVGPDEFGATWRKPVFRQTDDHPIVCITWNDAMAFCAWLSEQEKQTYRLPTEAEWEYACRAGTTTAYSFGDDERDVGRHGWYRANSGSKTHPTGLKQPNPWQLYDMHGNVAEWVMDLHGPYPNTGLTDPRGPAKGPGHVVRGGSWADDAHGPNAAYNLRSATRYYIYYSRIKLNWVGFRVVLEAE